MKKIKVKSEVIKINVIGMGRTIPKPPTNAFKPKTVTPKKKK